MTRTHKWKIFCRSTLFYLINSFTTELRYLRFSMVKQLQPCLARIVSKRCLFTFNQKNVTCLSRYLLGVKKNHRKNHLYLTNSKKVFHIVIREIFWPPTFATEWTSIGYCKTSNFFLWSIFLLSSPPSLTIMRFRHSSSMNKGADTSSKFLMSSIAIPSTSFSSIKTFSEEFPFSTKL